MNKKFKLTDKVTIESIRSPEFKRWLMRTLAVVCILSLIFQFSTCVYQGLNAYAAEDDSIVGTWVINETLNYYSGDTSEYYVNNVTIQYNGVTYIGNGQSTSDIKLVRGRKFYPQALKLGNSYFYATLGTTSSGDIMIFENGGYTNVSPTVELRTIIVISSDDEIFNAWLKANAVKQAPPTIHDFTNEIRVFNDDLTFFITNSTTWTEAFNFNFDVIGVGSADYIVLQRDVNNNYTMSYSYDFEGSGGLRTVYRFNHSTDTGGFFKENTKYIRFISNPENTDLQQWLLDNTTLVGMSDDIESFDTFYDMGFNVGYNSGYEQGFANSLIGDSLSGPINALSSITLIQIGDTVITLGGVIMTAIALCLVLAFLKLYAGG